jgi:hypothetical protein
VQKRRRPPPGRRWPWVKQTYPELGGTYILYHTPPARSRKIPHLVKYISLRKARKQGKNQGKKRKIFVFSAALAAFNSLFLLYGVGCIKKAYAE